MKLDRTTVCCVGAAANPISPDAVASASRGGSYQAGHRYVPRLRLEAVAGPFHSAIGDVHRQRADCRRMERRATRSSPTWPSTPSKHRVTLALEYLNRFECYFLNTAAARPACAARSIIPTSARCTTRSTPTSRKRASRPAIRAMAGHFIHVHISENDRGTPGTGMVHWDETFKTLKEVKYDGWMVIEAFGLALPDLAAATKIWRRMFKSEEQLSPRCVCGFMKMPMGVVKPVENRAEKTAK